jgi:hypothetical protein
MKKLFKLLLAIMIIVPSIIFAEEKSYEYFDFKIEMKPGEVISNTELKIFASIEGEENNLVDRTDEFNITDYFWSYCETDDCASTREVEDDSVFEENQKYVVTIIVNAKNGADINVWSADRAMLNGTPIEDLGGEYGNTGKELMLKPRINATPVVVSGNESIEETPEVISTNTKSCMFNLPICCNMFLGLSICIWILIIIVVLLIVIIACVLKSKNKKQE